MEDKTSPLETALRRLEIFVWLIVIGALAMPFLFALGVFALGPQV